MHYGLGLLGLVVLATVLLMFFLGHQRPVDAGVHRHHTVAHYALGLVTVCVVGYVLVASGAFAAGAHYVERQTGAVYAQRPTHHVHHAKKSRAAEKEEDKSFSWRKL